MKHRQFNFQVLAGCLVIAALVCYGISLAQEPAPEPTPEPQQTPAAYQSGTITYQFDIPHTDDASLAAAIKAIEAKAVSVLRNRSKITLAEARGILRNPDGTTNVSLCFDYLAMAEIESIKGISVVAGTISRDRAEPAQ